MPNSSLYPRIGDLSSVLEKVQATNGTPPRPHTHALTQWGYHRKRCESLVTNQYQITSRLRSLFMPTKLIPEENLLAVMIIYIYQIQYMIAVLHLLAQKKSLKKNREMSRLLSLTRRSGRPVADELSRARETFWRHRATHCHGRRTDVRQGCRGNRPIPLDQRVSALTHNSLVYHSG